ncbi:MAG: hypothetical protein K2Y26_01860 [Gemmatimonadaceae bacterium]|nr:hypothetical protein [Gemmatimonadaceae bacterium]
MTIVSNTAVDDSLKWRFERIAEIGGADSGVQAFDQVGWCNVATDGRGQIAVFDRDNGNKIQVFDTLGRHLRTVGSRGGGPGEVEFADGVYMDPRGMLSTFDRAKSAIVRWGPDGAALPELRGFDSRGRIWNKTVVHGDTVFTIMNRADSAQGMYVMERWTPRDTVTLDSIVYPRTPMVRFSCVGLAIPPLFEGQLAYAASTHGVAITKQSQYVVDVFRDGQRVRSVRRAIAPVRPTLDDASKLYPEGLRVAFGGGNACVVPVPELVEKLGMAPTIPVLRAITWGPDGSMWVERYTFEGETPRTDVFDADGGYLGTAHGRSLPLGFLGTDVVVFAEPNADEGSSRVGVFRIFRGR